MKDATIFVRSLELMSSIKKGNLPLISQIKRI